MGKIPWMGEGTMREGTMVSLTSILWDIYNYIIIYIILLCLLLYFFYCSSSSWKPYDSDGKTAQV